MQCNKAENGKHYFSTVIPALCIVCGKEVESRKHLKAVKIA